MRAQPTREEFTLTEKGLRHEPTGYEFVAHGPRSHSGTINKGQLGSVLADGRDYRPHEVEQMAERLWAEHCAGGK
jgi:hypothetical protein